MPRRPAPTCGVRHLSHHRHHALPRVWEGVPRRFATWSSAAGADCPPPAPAATMTGRRRATPRRSTHERSPVNDGHDAVLAIDNAKVWVPDGTAILRGISWTVRRGEHWALLGPNGSGKSTLLSLAGAVRHPSEGTVTVLGGRLGNV